MTPRLADVPPRVDPSVSSKHPFNRDPLLIPQLFVDTTPRWYRRPVILATMAIIAMIMLGVAVAVRVYTAEGLARRFSALVSPQPNRGR
jgi:hypothetical protein